MKGEMDKGRKEKWGGEGVYGTWQRLGGGEGSCLACLVS